LQKTSNGDCAIARGQKEPYHPPTITWVGSLAQAFTSLSSNPLNPSTPILPHLSSASNYSRIFRYADTKLFVAMFVREMAKHLPPQELAVMSYHKSAVSW